MAEQGRGKLSGLALMRKIGESIIIDVPGHGQIRVGVGYIDHDKVKLVTLAGPQIRIDREEIYNQRSRGAPAK